MYKTLWIGYLLFFHFQSSISNNLEEHALHPGKISFEHEGNRTGTQLTVKLGINSGLLVLGIPSRFGGPKTPNPGHTHQWNRERAREMASELWGTRAFVAISSHLFPPFLTPLPQCPLSPNSRKLRPLILQLLRM